MRHSGIFILGFISVFLMIPLGAFLWSDMVLFRVEVGMSKMDVHKIAGKPLSIRPINGGMELWDYTRSWSRDAKVLFDIKGSVITVETD